MSKKRRRQKGLQKKRAQRTMKRRQRARTRASSLAPMAPAPFDVPPSLPDDLPHPAVFAQAFIEMEDLGDEPEFADFAAALEDDLTAAVVKMIAENDDDMGRLEAAGDQQGVNQLIDDAKLKALQALITPALKAEVRRRLALLARRLQRQGQPQRADRVDALTQMLDWPPFPWAMFRPLADAFDETVGSVTAHLILRHAVAEAAGLPISTLSPERMAELTEDPAVRQRFDERLQSDEDLQDILYQQLDRVHEKLRHDLFEGHLNLALFTLEELVLWDALAQHRLAQVGVDLEEQDELSQQDFEILAKTMEETAHLLNTPARRERWREHLTQMEHEAPAREMQILLATFQDILTDPDALEDLDYWLLGAFAGEHRRFQKLRESDESLSEQLYIVYEQTLERLEQGGPLLP